MVIKDLEAPEKRMFKDKEYKISKKRFAIKTIHIARAIIKIIEKSIYLTTELYTPKNQKEITQNRGVQSNLIDCSKLTEKRSTSLITKANKLAEHKQIKSVSKTINFLFNLEVANKAFLSFIN